MSIILKSEVKDILYVGSTQNTDQRTAEHNSGRTKSTKPYIPWKLVFRQAFNDRITARRIEAKLKKNKNRAILEQIIEDGYIRTRSSAG